jgi:hypothetical protein
MLLSNSHPQANSWASTDDKMNTALRQGTTGRNNWVQSYADRILDTLLLLLLQVGHHPAARLHQAGSAAGVRAALSN